jgi:hypothetical protein
MMTLLGVLACVGAWSCGDNDNSPPPPEPSPASLCEVVGSLCHDAESDAGQACHELGHDGVPATCAAELPGCVDECLGAKPGDPLCRAIGSLCHAVDDDDGPLHACHELGHDGDAATCRARFDDCAARCLTAIEEQETRAAP